jgi:2-polyprenyl-3-methyl-5-hydroxy-6-metoxy-1,4-benzoquinol methylase
MPLRRLGIDACEARHLPPWASVADASLLDFGCGNGRFLQFAQSAGWKAKGLDLDPLAVAKCRSLGLDVNLGGVEILETCADSYQLITLSHVIEHVANPIALLAQCYRLLQPGGTLWIETPNIDSYGHRIFGRYWRGLEPPRHFVLFNVESLRELLVAVGFNATRHQFRGNVAPGIWQQSRFIKKQANELRTDFSLKESLLAAWVTERIAYLAQKHSEFINLISEKPGIDDC